MICQKNLTQPNSLDLVDKQNPPPVLPPLAPTADLVGVRKTLWSRLSDKARAKSIARRRERYYKDHAASKSKMRARYWENPERAREQAKQWYHSHKDLARQKQKLYVQKHKTRLALQNREYRLRRKYGLTKLEYAAMFESQSGSCAICKSKFVEVACVDHCHETNTVRSLLCRTCNTDLGHHERLMKSGFHKKANSYLLQHHLNLLKPTTKKGTCLHE